MNPQRMESFIHSYCSRNLIADAFSYGLQVRQYIQGGEILNAL